MSEWKKVKLRDCCHSISDGDHLPPPKSESGVPFITIANIDATNHIDFGSTMFVPFEYYENLNDIRKARCNDILYSVVGSFGKPVLIKENKSFAFQRHIAILRPNNEIADSHYLYYVMLSRDFYMQADTVAIGAAQRTISLTALRNMEVELPPMESQHRIATILSRYDSLIENYQKQIKLLEEAAQRLYKEWFVDLHFPGHENTKIVDGVPEGWEKNAFGSVIDYEIGGGWGSDTKTTNEIIPAYVIRGTDMSTLDMGIWKELPYRFHQESNYRARQLMHNDIIFEVSGGSKNEGVAKTFLVQQELLDKLDNHVICASFCKLIRLKDSSIAYYIYDTLKEWRASGITAQYDKRSASSIVNYRWKDFLSQQEILIPNEIVLRDYIKKSELIHSSITKKSSQIRLLTEARDRLLPKLMSGEIKIRM